MTQSGDAFPAAQRFEKLYRGDPSLDGGPKPIGIPWDIHQPQPQLMDLEALGGIAGAVLDMGCGLGNNSIFLASRGYSVTGLDSSPAAIEQASSRAADAGATVTFGVADATNLTGYDERFDTVIVPVLLHCDLDRAAFRHVARIRAPSGPIIRMRIPRISMARSPIG